MLLERINSLTFKGVTCCNLECLILLEVLFEVKHISQRTTKGMHSTRMMKFFRKQLYYSIN